jgi:hypothetical protein
LGDAGEQPFFGVELDDLNGPVHVVGGGEFMVEDPYRTTVK